MSELTTSTALGRITRIDGDFIQLESGYAFWLEPTLEGTQGIMLGDMVALMYDRQDMKVTSIRKAGVQPAGETRASASAECHTAIRKAGKDEDFQI